MSFHFFAAHLPSSIWRLAYLQIQFRGCQQWSLLYQYNSHIFHVMEAITPQSPQRSRYFSAKWWMGLSLVNRGENWKEKLNHLMMDSVELEKKLSIPWAKFPHAYSMLGPKKVVNKLSHTWSWSWQKMTLMPGGGRPQWFLSWLKLTWMTLHFGSKGKRKTGWCISKGGGEYPWYEIHSCKGDILRDHKASEIWHENKRFMGAEMTRWNE